VPRVIACVGGGPSLTEADARYAFLHTDLTIAINNAVDLLPEAQVCYAADYHWWDRRNGLPSFKGDRVAIAPFNRSRYPDVHVLENTGLDGLELNPAGLRTGRNSGYQAINLAVHLCADVIVLLGYDMKPSHDGRHHWHPPHEGGWHPNYRDCVPLFDTLVDPLMEIGVEVVNCSPNSALTTFPTRSLREVLRATNVDSDSLRADAREVCAGRDRFLPRSI
jgi:hypothetical protein